MTLAGQRFTADDFRRRALNQSGAPIDEAWRDHGDHLLNPETILEVADLKLKDAAVLIGVIDDQDAPRVILTQRTATLRKHSGQISLPGGGIDDTDASPEEAALREAEEEIGLDPALVEPLARLPVYLAGSGFRIVPVLSLIKPGFSLKPNPDEVAEVFDVPLSFLMDPDNHRQESRMWQGRVRHIYAMPYGERYIWGITAGILRTLYERLYA
ncbi:CoA pyrophosphatase [Rhizobium halophytocola]|uniref:8-oxo-dGTP pyrophosphatase MutT (NUDIX family) n=1 Tax=Rhizobium halophytocola TaxID=735519 RepID=A0ABS4E3P5_9HYPH|nr:CoA pyrophosphatase [Rhizobium halophytocola]MBP1852570.1 8-oxo-dGTP pyrophosphatase MutT (NUDIX family) [Rhizobium halophytocola]